LTKKKKKKKEEEEEDEEKNRKRGRSQHCVPSLGILCVGSNNVVDEVLREAKVESRGTVGRLR
jgi:hypothetical protein